MNDTSSKQRVLIVDDAPVNIKLLAGGLKSNYQVLFATNGPDALRMASSSPPPDLILLDIMMPEMDGYEVCKFLKDNDITKNIPVIFLTARSEVEDETMGLEIGAVDYITKPFNLTIVEARVKTHLELKRSRDLLEKLSSHDGLTGVPNRRHFDEMLDLEWRRARRSKSPISAIMIDIDFFKKFNDHYGHLAGDDCIKQVATALSSATNRASDFFARYGGEEFVALLPKTTTEEAAIVADKMRDHVEKLQIPHADSEAAACVTVSLGAATVIPSRGIATTELIEGADKALYNSKYTGRNRFTATQLE
jgi:diguanylate cyclase (GGDEF)-like protein